MNYKTVYDNIIKRAISRKRKDDEYYEEHHIVPSSLGGPDTPDNMASLTGREHFICHWLLYKIDPCAENAFAWHMMSGGGNKYHVGRYKSRYYEYARKAFTKHIGDVHRGKRLSEDHRRKLSVSKMGHLNPMHGKKHSEEHKAAISERMRGEKNPFYGKTHTDEFRKRQSEYASKRVGQDSNAYGMKHTKETKRMLSEMNKGKPRAKPHEKVLCPWCGKEGIKPNMKRWHFDNCKVALCP
jgi:hypothetical protein